MTEAVANKSYHELGKERLEATAEAKTKEDWDAAWKKPEKGFPFEWGTCWKHCVEYKVSDFPAEIGFFIDTLGFEANAFSPEYAMFTDPNKDCFFSIIPAKDDTATPSDAIRLQFMINDILNVSEDLKSRGVTFTDAVQPYGGEGSSLYRGTFQTPHGISIDIWGMVEK